MYRFMGEDLGIVGVDTAEGKFRCWNRDDQERLLDYLDPMAHDLGVDMGEYTLSFETANKTLEYLTGLRVEYERLTDTLDKMFKSWNECNILMCRLLDRFKSMKRRKTTYKTIRRDCAKRNRHK